MLSHLLNRGGWVLQHGLFLRATNPSHIRKPVMAATVPAVWAMFAAIRLASSLVSNFTADLRPGSSQPLVEMRQVFCVGKLMNNVAWRYPYI
jgi:hypothetical protein